MTSKDRSDLIAMFTAFRSTTYHEINDKTVDLCIKEAELITNELMKRLKE